MSWSTGKGWNFRETLAKVTDGADEIKHPSVDGQSVGYAGDVYPVSGNGTTYGTVISYAGQDGTRDHSTTPFDRRFGGCIFRSNSSTLFRFRIDLPAAGTYRIRIASGRNSQPTRLFFRILDDATSRLFINNVQCTADQYIDASGTVRASPSEWASSNAAVDVEFSTTTMIFELGEGEGASGGESYLAHLFIQQLAASTATPALGRYRVTGPSR